ncbi:unnamed protein product [Amoebophrya sp. A120]|nr:unnamed protein product [Amoebophrya sp. A120]|eukprot:GSA120T00014986001.1
MSSSSQNVQSAQQQVSAWFDPEVIAELRREFDAADLDKSGSIDVKEACVLFARFAAKSGGSSSGSTSSIAGGGESYYTTANSSASPSSSSSSSKPAGGAGASAVQPAPEFLPPDVSSENYRLAMRMLQQMNVRDGKITFEQFCFRFGRKLQQERNRQRRLILAQDIPFTSLDQSRNSQTEEGIRRSKSSREDEDRGDVEDQHLDVQEVVQQPHPLDTSKEQLATVIDEILREVNHARAQHSLQPMALHYHLCRGAIQHADDVASGAANFSHENAEHRIFSCGHFEGIGENLARLDGYALPHVPEGCVRGWENSPGHLRNMLLAEFNVCGIGVGQRKETTFITALFAIESDGAREVNCKQAKTRMVNGSVVREAARETTLLKSAAEVLLPSRSGGVVLSGNYSSARTAAAVSGSSASSSSTGALSARASAAQQEHQELHGGEEEGAAADDEQRTSNLPELRTRHQAPSNSRSNATASNSDHNTRTPRSSGQQEPQPNPPDNGNNHQQQQQPSSSSSQTQREHPQPPHRRGTRQTTYYEDFQEVFRNYHQPILFFVAWLLAFSFLHFGGHDLRQAPELIRRVEEIYNWLEKWIPLESVVGATGGHGINNRGDPSCWNGGFNFAFCCTPVGSGNPECWDSVFTYQRCCVADGNGDRR